MMAAAQAAAQAALLEVSASENNGVGSRQGSETASVGSVLLDQQGFNLVQSLSGSDMGQQNQQLLQDLLGMPINPDDPAASQLFQLLSEQQMPQQAVQNPHHLLDTSRRRSRPKRSRPDQHYLTISQNGAILEATQTITGYPADALLMTSVYDTIYDEDLPGFLCVKSQFWDRGVSDPEVYFRRRTIEGNWVWLKAVAVQYITDPINGYILLETRVDDEALAKRFNRTIKVTAVLVQAVEAALLTGNRECDSDDNNSQNNSSNQPHPIQQSSTYQTLLESLQATGVTVSEAEEMLQSMMRTSGESIKDLTSDQTGIPKQQKKGADAVSLVDSVRQGVRLDLGLTELFTPEVKLIALVLSGAIPVEQVAPLVLHSLRYNQPLNTLLCNFEKPMHSRIASKNMYPESVVPPIAVINLSYSYIGNSGLEVLASILPREGSSISTIDVSFCGIDEKGFLALARGLQKRKKKGILPLKCLVLSGNYLTVRSAAELGTSLSPSSASSHQRKRLHPSSAHRRSGYDSDSNDSDIEDEEEVIGAENTRMKRAELKNSDHKPKASVDRFAGIQILHVSLCSITDKALGRLLTGLSVTSTIRELNLSSNNLRSAGASILVQFLETKQRVKGSVAMPQLDRLDMSNNALGDDGTTQLTRAVSKRSEVHFVDLKLSNNSIGAGGIETMMNKLLQHNLRCLSLDKNAIGDQGCQLVAASLNSMKSLMRLNLGYNQIGSRGINSLMRSVVACESITYLGLSGNILKISGAIALAFTLSQHPRLEELDLDNCCLGQAAQCHITAGAISNRFVPMKQLRGYAVGPPMVAIGALKPYAQSFNNEECFRIRKDEQMKNMLQWMESNRNARRMGVDSMDPRFAATVNATSGEKFLTPEFVSSMNDVHGTPSQNSYFRLLGWIGRIPFDDDELNTLQKFFYDTDGGEGDRGSDGYINLKLRGDLLAALDSEAADEFREEFPRLGPSFIGSTGIDLNKLHSSWDAWAAFVGKVADEPSEYAIVDRIDDRTNEIDDTDADHDEYSPPFGTPDGDDGLYNNGNTSCNSVPSRGMTHVNSTNSSSSRERRSARLKARISMFPQFELQLEELKATATEMIEHEEDPMQHEVILTQYAEASLTILRQLRYHCMNSGFDGWRQGGLKRKILIIDDSKVTRKLVSRAFEKANFIVDTAANGAEGVDKMKASIYDIAFMDIDMPVMDGFEATKKLRDWEDVMRPGARQPICALTAAYVDDFERSELMKFKDAGLDVMESKPCNIPRLFKVVDDVSPMFSDLSISVIQREQSDSSFSSSYFSE